MFLTTIVIFEIGSLFCAVAPSVGFLIFGRAVAGTGGAGLWVSILSIMAQVTFRIVPFFSRSDMLFTRLPQLARGRFSWVFLELCSPLPLSADR